MGYLIVVCLRWIRILTLAAERHVDVTAEAGADRIKALMSKVGKCLQILLKRIILWSTTKAKHKTDFKETGPIDYREEWALFKNFTIVLWRDWLVKICTALVTAFFFKTKDFFVVEYVRVQIQRECCIIKG